jgi:hypothetical protein
MTLVLAQEGVSIIIWLQIWQHISLDKKEGRKKRVQAMSRENMSSITRFVIVVRCCVLCDPIFWRLILKRKICLGLHMAFQSMSTIESGLILNYCTN